MQTWHGGSECSDDTDGDEVLDAGFILKVRTTGYSAGFKKN